MNKFFQNMSALYIMLCYNDLRKIGDFMKLIHFINDENKMEIDNIINLEEKKSKKYKFFLDNIMNYIYITDRLIFIRENDDYKFELEISKKPVCTITLKDENKSFNINITNANFEESEHCIDIYYELETDNDKHHVILEIGD